jgi:hypothetical protein
MVKRSRFTPPPKGPGIGAAFSKRRRAQAGVSRAAQYNSTAVRLICGRATFTNQLSLMFETGADGDTIGSPFPPKGSGPDRHPIPPMYWRSGPSSVPIVIHPRSQKIDRQLPPRLFRDQISAEIVILPHISSCHGPTPPFNPCRFSGFKSKQFGRPAGVLLALAAQWPLNVGFSPAAGITLRYREPPPVP